MCRHMQLTYTDF